PSFLRPRAQYLENLAENYQLFKNKFYLSIFYSNQSQAKGQGIFKKIKSLIQGTDLSEESYHKAFANVNDRVAELSNVFNLMVEMLSSMGAQYTLLKEKQQVYDIIQQFTRPDKSKIDSIEI